MHSKHTLSVSPFAYSIHVCSLLAFFVFLLALLLPPEYPGPKDENLPKYSPAGIFPLTRPMYTFAVHPLHNPQRLFSIFQPLVDAINAAASDFQVRLVASRDYATFERRLYAGQYAIALPNPLQTLISLKHGYQVVGKMANDNGFHGIIITRRDTAIMFVEDLADRPLSFPAPTALAATLMTKYFLKTRGLELGEDNVHYVGSQESAIMNVYLGKTVAAGSWPQPWEQLLRERPQLKETLKVQWRTPPLVNNGLVVRGDMPPAHVEVIVNTLVGLAEKEIGRRILEAIPLAAFEKCTLEDYEPVMAFIARYNSLFSNEIRELMQ